MPYIAWNPSKELGHAVIDREHRELVELLNRLIELLFDPAADDEREHHVRKQQVVDAVDALGRATKAHFASEDAIMRAVDYPGLAEHRAQHAELIVQFGSFAERFHSALAGSVPLELRFLREWFEYHIENFDAPMVSWLREQKGPRR